jgi:hypothetical protein
MRTLYRHTMMRRKIRKMIGHGPRWRVPPEIARLRLLPMNAEERRLLFGAYPIVSTVAI